MMRKSLGIRNWEAAQKIVRDWESREGAEHINVSVVCERFIADCEARGLRKETMWKYKLMARELLEKFARRPIDAISVEDLAELRESWKVSPISSRKKMERVKYLFKFAVERGWCEKNPAGFLKPPKEYPSPKLPFTEEEMAKIMEAIEQYPNHPPGRRDQVRAFILLLRYSGLRIRDAVAFSKDKLVDGKVMLSTHKTGQMVWVPVPAAVCTALEPLGYRPFWSGNGLERSGTAAWQRTLKTLFRIAGIKGNAHKFRHTFSIRLLEKGVSLENVATLLGNTPRIVFKHYAPWVKSRQDALAAEVRRTFR